MPATSDGKLPVRLVLPAQQARAMQGQTAAVSVIVTPEGAPASEAKTLQSTFLVPR